MNIFERASRNALRFPSVKGQITTEQLWLLPLQSKSGFDLDSVAKEVNAQLKSVTEESFVATVTNPAKSTHELQLEIVKYVIAARIAENAINRDREARLAERNKLVSILADKQDESLKALSADEIAKRIADLGA